MQFRRKQKLAEQLKQQQAELAEKQREREAQLKTLKSEVSLREGAYQHKQPSRKKVNCLKCSYSCKGLSWCIFR